MGETTGQAAIPQEPASGFEKTILDKGWVNADQVATAVRHQAERKAAGETLTLAQACVALNLLTKDQVRQAMSSQGEKASLRCPTCRKVYTVWGYKPGSKSTCKTCKVALIPTGDTAAAALKEAGKATDVVLAKPPTSAEPAILVSPALAVPPPPLAPVPPGVPGSAAPPLAPASPVPATPAAVVAVPALAPISSAVPASAFLASSVDPAMVHLIPGYTIQRCLGSGAMGDVYLAQQMSLDRPVAIKLLPPELAKNQEFVQRFMTEARAAGKLSHENIVAAVDVGESNGRYYFVMEVVEGATLQDILKRVGKLPEKTAMGYAKQIATGLRHAHQMGLIHRDIKPANIMIHGEKTAKICDFGLAREVDSDVTLTIPGTVQSSPAYASPEQCRGRRDLDHRTDMYSLGVTLFEMLTGRRPFVADSPGALFIKHATEAPPSPQSLAPSISAAANQFVLRLLKKEPKQRFDSYDQLIEAIDSVLVPKKPQITAKATRRIPGKQAPPWRAKVLGMAAAAVLLGGAGVIYLKVVKPQQEAKTDAVAKSAPDPEVEKLLRAVSVLENRIEENPASIPSVRARWKELGEQFKGTPHYAAMVRRQHEFDIRSASLAETSATKTIADAAEKVSDSRLIEAMQILRGYSPGFAGTDAADRISQQLGEVERMLETKYHVDRERLLGLLVAGKADDARASLPALKALISWTDAEGQTQFIRPELRNEIDLLGARIDEVAKVGKPATPGADDPKPNVPAPAGPGVPPVAKGPAEKSPPEKGPPPPIPDFVAVLRNPVQRADPKGRMQAALGFRGLAPRSAVCRAAEVFLLHPEAFWKLADGSPLAKALNEYLASVPLERADTMASAEHQGYFVSLAKKASDLGSVPKDVIYLFMLAHADELFGQNLRPDGEGIRLAGLQGAKSVDFWGRPETVNRLALSRLVALAEVNPVELRRAMEPNKEAIDFPTRYLMGIAAFRDKEFDPGPASALWKRMGAMMAETPSAGKYCDEVAERLKKASVCDGCNGVGKYGCKKCMATGLADCDKCKGSGKIKDPFDTSSFAYLIPCPACKGKGKVLCPLCLGSHVQKCEKCQGKKLRPSVPGSEFIDVVTAKLCSSCAGTGNVFSRTAFPCPDCDGLGRQFPK
ncbi:MAG TPA: protein kinase [Planctomycetota bacterium]|nr:protein kinase [Planctomycetota bacterium]